MSLSLKIDYSAKALILHLILLAAILSNAASQDGEQESILRLQLTADSLNPKMALVLSGGGARGVAQVGAIRALAENDIEPDYIVGTSIGSVIGGLFACGYGVYEIDSIFRSTDWSELFAISEERNRSELFLDQKIITDRSLLTLRFRDFKLVVPEAVSVGAKYYAKLQELVWNAPYNNGKDFDDLRYPFRCVSTDLVSGSPYVFERGNIVRAIRASTTFPLRFTPVVEENKVLVDGGIMTNIPVDAALQLNPDFVVAVSSISPLLNAEELDKPWNIADQVISITMNYFSEEAARKVDFMISPDIEPHSNTDFQGLDSLIEAGYNSTVKLLPELKDFIMKKKDSLIVNRYIKPLKEILGGKTLSKVIIAGFDSADSSGLAKLVKGNGIDPILLVQYLKVLATEKKYASLVINLSRNGSENVLHLSGMGYPEINDVLIVSPEYNEADSLARELSKHYFGKKFTPGHLEQIRETIIRHYRKNGYSFAQIDTVFIDPAIGAVNIAIDEGIIREINLLGNSAANRVLIERELGFTEGEPANASKIISAWENLSNTDIFGNVEVDPVELPDRPGMSINVRVDDIGTQIVRIGGRVDNERNAQLGLDLIQENFLNIGSRLMMRLKGGDRNNAASLAFEMPRIFSTLFTAKAETYYSKRDVYTYREKPDLPIDRFDRERTGEIAEERYGARFTLGTQIERSGIMDFQLRYEKQRHYSLEDGDMPPYYNVSSIKAEAIFDSENKTDFPTEGRFLDLSLESTFLQTPSTVGFSKAHYYHRINYTIGASTFIPSFVFGYADETLPLPEFFSLGGQSSFFGLREDEERGRQLIRTSLEYRLKSPFNLFFDTYFSLRYDLGAIWEVPENIKFNKLKHGAGATLAFDTPLGPAAFSLGKAFFFLQEPASVVWGQTMFYFSIGLEL